MRHRYAKITCLILISFLALFGSGCGEQGAASGPGSGAAIDLTLLFNGLPADGVSSGQIQATVLGTSGGTVPDGARVSFTTTLGTFRNGKQSYNARTEGGRVTLSLMAGTEPGIATITAASNGVSQSISVPIGGVASILLSALPTSLPANGVSSTTITATLRDSQDLAVPIGTQVAFTTSTGTFQNGTDAITAVTTTNAGTVSVALMAPASAGTAVVTATAMGVTQQIEVEFYRALPPATLALRAVPTVIHPFGTTTLTATVKDLDGYPIVGETVIFSVLSNDGEGTLGTLSVITNVNGEAVTTYTAGSNAGTDIIGARTAGNGVSGSVSILVDPTAVVVGNITVISGSASLVADGTSQTLIRATVTSIDGNPASGKRVNFTTTAGTLTAASAVTDSRGIAEVRLRSSRNAGTATVRAESDGLIAAVDVEFIPGPASWILMYAFPDVVNPNDVVNIEAAVMDVNNNRLSGERVKFLVRKAGEPEILNTAEQITDDDGVVRTTFVAFHGEGLFEVTASTINGTSATVTFLVDKDAIVVGSITVVAGTDRLPADGTSTTVVRATVLDKDGRPATDVEVTFSTTLGTLSATTATTDKNGMAEVVLRSTTTAGTATITADAHGWKARTTVQFTALSPDRIFVEVIPGRVIPGGAATVQATLWDVNNNPIAGEQLNFAVTQNRSGGSLAAATGITDANGQVRIVYTAGPETGLDIFRVTVNSKQSVFGTATLNITSDGFFVGWITLTSSLPSIPADNVSSTAITATVYDSAGNPVPSGTAVTFRTTLGRFSNGQQTIIRGTVDDTGVVATTLIAGTTGGIAAVTAESGGVSQAVYVFFDDGAVVVGQISLTATPDTIPADGFSSSTIRAEVRDSSGNPVPIGTTVIFNTDLGTFLNGMTSIALNIANTSGIISTPLIAGMIPGLATVTATSGGVTQAVTVNIIDSIIPVAGTITLTSALSSIPADGFSSTGITAVVRDTTGVPMPQGTTVNFTTTLGTFPNGLQTITLQTAGTTGTVITSLIAGVTGGVATITAESGGVTQLLNIIINDGTVSVGSIVLTANPTSISADGTSSSAITAVIRDTSGNPVPIGTPVVFDTTHGTFSNGFASISLATTSASGTVITSLIAANTPGNAVVTATAGGVSQSTAVAMVTGVVPQVGSITLTANPATITTGGASTITAIVRDTAGNPMPQGTEVTISTPDPPGLGTFPNNSNTISLFTASASGTVVTTFMAGVNSGVATITATSGGVTRSIQVTIQGAGLQVDSIEVLIVNTTLNADGVSKTDVIATAKTADNQAVPNAEIVFTATAGLITSPHTTDAGGQATAQITSDRWNRPLVTVTASSQGVSGSATMQFVGVTLTLAASPSSQVLGFDSTITATLRDAANQPIAGATVDFITDKGNFAGDDDTTSAFTNAAGVATVVLQNATLTGDATVTGTSRGATGTVIVNFGDYQLVFEPSSPAIIEVNGGMSTITARLKQYGGAACPGDVVGETINFSTTLGTITISSVTGPSCTADAGFIYADATATLTSGAQGGTATIDAWWEDINGVRYEATTTVSIISENADKIILEADPNVISVNGGVSTIRALVLDVDDNPVVGQTIYFRILQGPGGSETLSPSLAVTDADGRCVSFFTAGTIPSNNIGDVVIEAADNLWTNPYPPGTTTGSCNLTIAGLVHQITVGVNLEELPAPALEEGHLKVGVSGIATDINGNPVADGTQINFSVRSIKFNEDRDNDGIIHCWDAPGQLDSDLIACPGVGVLGVGWFSDDVNQDGCIGSGCMAGTEDTNGNGLLDPGEDKNGNGVLDPVQGTLIESPKTTTDGVATTWLVYPMSYAANIKVRITAEAGGKTNFYDYELLCTETMVDNGTCGLGY